MQREPPKQKSSLTIVTSANVSLSKWLIGFSYLNNRLYERSSEHWKELNEIYCDVRDKADHLIYEGLLNPNQSADEALKIIYDNFLDCQPRLTKAMAKAEQALGRKELIIQFSKGGNAG
jgi:hypothetical protein